MTVDLAYRPRLADMRPLAELADLARQREIEAAKGPGSISPAAVFEGRTGYDASFLEGFEVPWPSLGESLIEDLLPVGDDNRLNYMHFSVAMSKSRRMALYVGVNIDGMQTVQIKRVKDT